MLGARGSEIGDLRADEDNLRAADFMIVQSPHGTEDSSVELLYRLQVTARR